MHAAYPIEFPTETVKNFQKIFRNAIDGLSAADRIHWSLADDPKIRSIQSKLFNNQVKYKSYSVTPTVVGEI